LGGLSDGVIAGLQLRPVVRLAELQHMAEFTRSGKAVTQGGSWGPGAFVTAYRANRQAASSVTLDDSHLAQAMRSLAKYHGR
jgi:putative DNA primase/helicase